MQQDPDVIDALQADLAELTALHAPSGSEQPVIARLRDLFTPLVDTVTWITWATSLLHVRGHRAFHMSWSRRTPMRLALWWHV